MEIVNARVNATASVELKVRLKKLNNGEIELEEVLEILDIDDVDDIDIKSEL